MRQQDFSVLHLIKDSIRLIPNGRIERLRISLMEFLPMTKFIGSADHHINERLAVQLYRKSNPPWVTAWDSPPWVSFNNQLDTFYEGCRLNKIENETVRYFYSRKISVNEFPDFENSYQCKEDSRIALHFNNTWKRYARKVREFDKMARKQNWSREQFYKNRRETVNKSNEFVTNRQKRIRDEREHTAQFPGFLDHQLFYGSRTTIEFTCNSEISITEQFNHIIENDWSYKNLMSSRRKLLRVHKKSIKKVRKNIISDIDQQVDLRKRITDLCSTLT